MFRSIRSAVGAIISMAVITTTAVVLTVLVTEHEERFIVLAKQRAHTVSTTLVSELRPLLEKEAWSERDVRNVMSLAASDTSLIGITLLDEAYQTLITEDGKQAALKAQVGYDQLKPSRFVSGNGIENGVLVSVDRIGSTVYPLGHIMLVFDIEGPLSASTRALVIRSLPFIGLFLILSLLVYLYLVHRWLSSVNALSGFLRNVNDSKDYTLRYPENKQREISALARNVNNLLETMETELTINYEQNQTLVEQQQTMTRLANYDSLTGLPNRQFVMDNLRLELARARRHQEDLVLMFFDLDGFKGINDSLGHETGDLILIEVADRVTTLLREGDLIARLGGDEFIVLPDRDTSDASIHNMADRLISAFSEPFQLRGLALNVGISMGVARASDADYDLSQLMSNADLAMYRSKAKGRGIYTVFTPDMVESYKRKLSIANSIDQGLMNSEFIVYYQPKIGGDGHIVGFEALLRWYHPEFGMVMPGEFIPIAEQGGKITALTRYVIEQVCIQLPLIKQWMKRRFKVAVNLSGHDLRDAALFDSIHALFLQHGINPEYIEFEVTESAYLENFALSNKFFRRVSNMGCAISLDDFGTGYSSLSYLTQISIDTLKIDRQFISEIETSERSRLVTGAIIDLAKRLSLSICAEGIEHIAQWEYLLDHGCDHVQGYLFSRPVPLEELQTLPNVFDKTQLLSMH
ncbi:putative bifunctional diguanylate cyclase/phosphodiesterase [Alteromonas sp. CYL-A6]|uniref:putative bifunctional diguanylate cyclase/phosphodiesterase n=1 Tax=Alteromonas nitratireducens TaxID=3390813 RepID=UPI0034B94B63